MMRPAAKSFTDLDVWQQSHAFVLAVYRETSNFPREERFHFCTQFRRAAVSIPANIAEGFGRFTARDKARFFNTAQGSLEECRYYCILARDLGYGETADLLRQTEDVSRLLLAYLTRLRATRLTRFGLVVTVLAMCF